jgi:hypothetical protein
MHIQWPHTVKRWGYKLDLDLVLGGVLRLGASQGSLDSIDTLVSEAGDYKCQYKYLDCPYSSDIPSMSDRTLVG